ncbi:hypothetical protein EWM64_g3790 [Hericium alpestre]|uniref:Yeast cell wall synthesis Kre9/Knh1-like N-terminal domain-containing protein n=1 Tax=Hericium alpestre TaxID=135208 RepID=A0A4Y9ZZE8_9AGAM|nr:hypothetical protein EWM64_g3790 [Hericium alpestre]
MTLRKFPSLFILLFQPSILRAAAKLLQGLPAVRHASLPDRVVFPAAPGSRYALIIRFRDSEGSNLVFIADIHITGPSSNAYWVQNISNTISWTYSPGDPSPVDIIVTNTENTTLNGEFSIAQFVNTFTVTNVTLRPGSNYQVVFASTNNHSQIFANSTNFDVKPPGTSPAPTSTTSSGSPSSTTGGNSTAPSSTSSAPVPVENGAFPLFHNAPGVLFALGACGIASLSGLFL